MTIRATARFTVREDDLPIALDAIRGFVRYAATEPGTLRYEALRSVERPTEFLHVMEFSDEEAQEEHSASEPVQAFTAVLYPACESEPTFERWEAIT